MAGERPSQAKGQPAQGDKPATRPPWLWNVVLLDDQDHTIDYVVRMMQDVFHHTREQALAIAHSVDTLGRAVCLTTHKEHAEFKREQVLAFGRDPLTNCARAMCAIIEPAEAGGES
ncbi:MAG: ATP-dependent Clp protease adaptor ClpS [Phycisphaerae bacterium]|nr:ATP-dependent Clp protease adaptor ClpS [Phycisphaerae bacterium]